MVTWRVILLLLLCCTRPEPASLEVGFDGERAFREQTLTY